MEVKIQTREVHLGKRQESAIRQKFVKLSKFADRIGDESTEIRVELVHSETRKKEDSYLCVLTMFVPQDTLRAESRSDSLETAIDEVLEKIKAPIERYKDKTNRISKRK